MQRAFPPPASPATGPGLAASAPGQGLGGDQDNKTATTSDKTSGVTVGATTVIGLSAFHQAQASSASGSQKTTSLRSQPVCSSCYNQGGDFNKLLTELQSMLSFKEEELREREQDLKVLQSSLTSAQSELTQVRTLAREEKQHMQDLLLRVEVSSSAGQDDLLQQLQQMRIHKKQLEDERQGWRQQKEDMDQQNRNHEMNNSRQATLLLQKDDALSSLQHQLDQLESTTTVLNDENRALMMELDRLRKQTANETTRHMASEARCRAELKDEQEELARMRTARDEDVLKIRDLEEEVLFLTSLSERESQDVEARNTQQQQQQQLQLQQQQLQQQLQLISRLEQTNGSLREELVMAREHLAAAASQLSSSSSSSREGNDKGNNKGIRGSGSSSTDIDEYAESMIQQQRIRMAEKDAEIGRLHDLLLRVEVSSSAGQDDLLQQLQQMRIHAEQLEDERQGWRQQKEDMERERQREVNELQRQLQLAKEDNDEKEEEDIF